MTTTSTAHEGSILHIAARRPGVADAIARGLADAQRIYTGALRPDHPPVAALCSHVEQYRGKMLRPSLVFASALASGGRGVGRDHAAFAAVVEMIHVATLVHDDVLDDARTRRRVPTVNALRGNEAAVILGDYLISSAFHLCSGLDDQAVALRVGAATTRVCEGELLQLHHRHDYGLSLGTYREIIDRKTSALIELACEVGASLAGAGDEAVRAWGAFGRDIGSAFQIRDDLLDLIGDEREVGKTRGSDLSKGKLTFPMIHHLARAARADRARMIAVLARLGAAGADSARPVAPEVRGAVVRALRATGSIDAAQAEAAVLVERARAAASALPDTPARALLMDLAGAVASRDR